LSYKSAERRVTALLLSCLPGMYAPSRNAITDSAPLRRWVGVGMLGGKDAGVFSGLQVVPVQRLGSN